MWICAVVVVPVDDLGGFTLLPPLHPVASFEVSPEVGERGVQMFDVGLIARQFIPVESL